MGTERSNCKRRSNVGGDRVLRMSKGAVVRPNLVTEVRGADTLSLCSEVGV